ncbi:hypothetical protein FGO68_gene9509 [Halteria grandinella]|uniref:Uncharacterized protein n=1 Tax=Halteria grandinella TaxID=5974 RepID=A0A8J8NEL8_HALGN|nr:hypothetical protein FGO68_gene9509 [Halteria grandinella]
MIQIKFKLALINKENAKLFQGAQLTVMRERLQNRIITKKYSGGQLDRQPSLALPQCNFIGSYNMEAGAQAVSYPFG